MAAFVCLLFVVLMSGAALLFMKDHDQRTKDRQRKTYRLTFPNDLNEENILAWLYAISGSLRKSTFGVTGDQSIAFEVWATSTGIVHRLKVPWQKNEYVINELRNLIPGLSYRQEDEFPWRPWTKAGELRLTNTSRQLRILSSAVASTSILSALEDLHGDETVMMQLVVVPALPRHPPVQRETRSTRINARTLLTGNLANHDEVNDRREKLEHPNFSVSMRVASFAASPARARHLIVDRLLNALAGSRSAAVRFERMLVPQKMIQGRIEEAAAPRFSHMQLSAPELTALIAWPVGNPFISGLAPYTSRQFPPNETIPRDGIRIGHSSFSAAERPVAIPFEQALMHIHVLGSTGVGKSVLLSSMAKQVMEAGYGLILMETEGNLYQSVLDYVPKERVNDVVLFDVADQKWPVGFNVLDQGNPMAVIDQIIDLFMHRFGKEGMGVWAQEYIYHGLRTIASTPGLTFTDLATLLLPRTPEEIEWVDNVGRGITDPELRRWWQRHDNRDRTQQQQRADPVLSRIWQLASRPELRFIMGQSSSSFQISDLMRENKILLVNLKGVSKDTASLAGTLLMNAIWQATKNTRKAKPTFLLLDEFADFMDLPIDTESMLAQARKHGVGMVLANQHMAQLKPSVREAVLTNARNKVIFQTNADDARLVSRELGRDIEVEAFTNLQAYGAIARIQTPAGPSTPVSIKTEPPERKAGNGKEVIEASRKRYARPLHEVQQEIENRHRTKPNKNVRRPKVGSDDSPPQPPPSAGRY